MNVIMIAKNTFDVIEYNGIKNIAFDGTNYVLTRANDTTVSYAKADYQINIKW